MMRMPSRKAAAAAAALLIAAGAGTATAAALDGSSDEATPIPAKPVVAVPVAPAPRYSAVERSDQRATKRVAQMQDVLAARFPDVAGRTFRGVRATDGTQTWVVSGSKHTCFGADNGDGTGYTCVPNGAAARGISVAERRDDGSQRTIALLPDGVESVTAGGRVVPTKDNVAVVEHRADAVLQANPADGRASFRVGTE